MKSRLSNYDVEDGFSNQEIWILIEGAESLKSTSFNHFLGVIS